MYKNEHKFPYRWTKKDANFTKDKGKVMSCFCCGGGSSFGYKLAGYDVVACNEIDPKVMKMYLKNHDVKYSFNCDIRELIANINMGGHIMKEELHNLDILDASFPCSVFSIAGDRQKAWGKEKVFREGQKAQRLDDLAFYSIALAKELQPKVVVFENVQGLLQGEAIEYVKEIYSQMDNAGYILQHWLLNARNMGVPQNRPRVFFLGLRKDLCKPFMVQKDLFERVPKIDMDFNEKEIVLDEFSDYSGRIENGIAKSHAADAFCIAKNVHARKLDSFFMCRCVPRHTRALHVANPKKGGIRRSTIASHKIGKSRFQRFDMVRWKGKECFIFGSSNGNQVVLRTANTEKVHNSAKINIKTIKFLRRLRNNVLVEEKASENYVRI